MARLLKVRGGVRSCRRRLEANDVRPGVKRRGCCRFASDDSDSKSSSGDCRLFCLQTDASERGEASRGIKFVMTECLFSRGIDVVVGCRKAGPGRLLAEQVKQVTSTAGSVNWLECGDPVREIYKLGPTPSVFSFDTRGRLSR